MLYEQSEEQNPLVDGKPMEMCVCESVNGIRCTLGAQPGSQFCPVHHPWHLVGPKELLDRIRRGQVMTAYEVADFYRPLHLVDADDLLMLLEYVLKELLVLENSVERNQLIVKLLEIAIEVNKRRDKERTEREIAEGRPISKCQVTLFQLWRRRKHRTLDEIIQPEHDEEECEYY